ncbi:hypothetical protein LENED_007312 [Lentinula edodes]|uniref:DUF2421 domain-containing protein n=1 Tax=Lentinula edodes TaxID=5353 RepID=A0A1Q3EE09_LENED|nr:hypothetical protein LENED_007312 [Lentinula edodes]
MLGQMAPSPSYSVFWSFFSSRHFLARIVSTLLCSILIVIQPFSKYGGSLAFLALTIKELNFAPQDNLAHQLEGLVLNLFGGLTGIGISLLGNYIASLTGDTALARTIPAVFLAFICFLMGWLKSALPRLTMSSRLVCFISIWMFTQDPGAKSESSLMALYCVWLVLTAAFTSFCSCLIFLRWSTAHFAQDIASALSSLHHCLESNLQSPFQFNPDTPAASSATLTSLRTKAVALSSSYQQASFELRFGRIGVKSIKPLISIVEHLRREISWGMSFPQVEVHYSSSDAFEGTVIGFFRQPATDLGHAILDSISLVRSAVLKCYDAPAPVAMLDDSTINRAKDQLTEPSEEILQEISLGRKLQRNDIEDPGTKTKGLVRMLYRFRFNKIIWSLWNHPIILQARLKLHELVMSFKKSSRIDIKHAFKNALGVSMLAIPAFLPASSAGRQWFIFYRGQWMLITYIWVLETNTGATLRVGYLRIAGTILGALYGYIASLISQNNPYALVALVTFAEIPISAAIMRTSFPSVGVVANITLPPILFSNYITGMDFATGELATIRGMMICAGIAGAVVVNGFVFPRHARVIFLDGISQILESLTKLYMGLSRDLLQTFGSQGRSKQKTMKSELRIRNALQRMSNLITSMGDELSLVPIPMKKYRHLVRTLQKLLDLFTGLRKIRENIPRRETVIEVAEERRELISCICVSLFACEQVFLARHTLPQFLPSYRQALENLKQSIDLHMRNTREKLHGPMGLSLVYALAETNILTDIVETIDELLELSRQLFGTAACIVLINLEVYMPGQLDYKFSRRREQNGVPK